MLCVMLGLAVQQAWARGGSGLLGSRLLGRRLLGSGAFLAGAFLAGAFLAGAFLAGAFLAGAFLAAGAFFAAVDLAAVLVFFAVDLVAVFFAGAFFAADVEAVLFDAVDLAAVDFEAEPDLVEVAFLATDAADAVTFLAPAAGFVTVSLGSFFAPETTALRSAPAVNLGIAVFLALIRSPVRGLRTHRASRTRFSNEPNPVMATFSPLATSRVMVSSTDSERVLGCLAVSLVTRSTERRSTESCSPASLS